MPFQQPHPFTSQHCPSSIPDSLPCLRGPLPFPTLSIKSQLTSMTVAMSAIRGAESGDRAKDLASSLYKQLNWKSPAWVLWFSSFSLPFVVRPPRVTFTFATGESVNKNTLWLGTWPHSQPICPPCSKHGMVFLWWEFSPDLQPTTPNPDLWLPSLQLWPSLAWKPLTLVVLPLAFKSPPPPTAFSQRTSWEQRCPGEDSESCRGSCDQEQPVNPSLARMCEADLEKTHK